MRGISGVVVMNCRRLKNVVLCSALFLGLASLSPSYADDEAGTLGIAGLSTKFTLTSDLMGVVSGGQKRRTSDLNNLDMIFDVDTQKAHLWDNGKLHMYLLGDWGTSPAPFTGALQANDNIDAPDTFKVYEAYYEHQFCDGCISVLTGLQNYNSEFDLSELAGTLIHSSFGIGAEVAQVGPSIFPTTSLGFRVKAHPSDTTYILAGVYDGVPGDPNNRKGTHIIFKESDGLYWAGEVGIHSTEAESAENFYKVGVGGWYKTTDYTDFNGVDRSDNGGFYVTVDKSLFHEEDKAQGLGVFAQAGWTQQDRNEISHYLGGGFSYTGLIPGRNKDVTALGFARAMIGSDYRGFDSNATAAETAYELTYRAALLDWLTVQPDLQYIVSPGAQKGNPDAWLMGLRVQLSM